MAENINDNLLISCGYKEYPDSTINAEKCFQKCFRDEYGKRFFLNFRKWDQGGKKRYDCQLCTEMPNDGYGWLTFRQDTLANAEKFALALWRACGEVYYERHGS